MTPLTKETVEATSQTAGSALPRTVATAPNPAQQRSEAVSLEIPIKVHGSRVTEVVMGVTPHTEPFEEQSTTMIVFAQGGVLKMSTPVNTGQMMVLTNLKTRQDVICRVLKVRNNPNLQSYVEIEFTHPQPGYWGVFFPSDDSELAPKATTPSQALNSEPQIRPETAPDVSRPFASSPVMSAMASAKPPLAVVPPVVSAQSPAPVSYVTPPHPGSAFISIGSQEEVQVAASSTLSRNARLLESIKADRALDASRKSSGGELANLSSLPSAPAFSGAYVVELTERAQSKIELQPLAEIPSATATRTFGDFGVSSTSASPREVFGSTLGVSAAGNLAESTEPRRNWLLIAACAAFGVVTVAAGAMYFSGAPARKAAVTETAVAPTASGVETSQSPAQSAAVDQAPYSIPAPRTDSAPIEPHATERPTTTRGSKVIVTDHLENAPAPEAVASVNQKTAASAPISRPVTATRGRANPVEAPTLDAEATSPGAGGTLAGMVGSSSAIPPPPSLASPAGVGGSVTPPKLISSVPPVYPPAAKEARVDGDVIVHAVIDKNGNVSEATVISGPSILRQAAVNAVRGWKYSPSVLNGQPIASDATVTLKFRH